MPVLHSENSTSQSWRVDLGGELVFSGEARQVDSIVAVGPIKNGSNQTVYGMPYVKTRQGGNNDRIDLFWEEEVKGDVLLSVRIDD